MIFPRIEIGVKKVFLSDKFNVNKKGPQVKVSRVFQNDLEVSVYQQSSM